MSIKTLYRGFKFRTNDLLEIHERIMEWRQELEGRHRQALASLFAKLAVAMVDREALKPGTYAGKVPLAEAWSGVWDMQREVKAKGLRNPLVDFDFSISILPHGGEVFGIVYTDQHEWFDLWLAKDFVTEFAYWNSGDAPEEIGAEEWERRGDIWRAILEDNGYRTPAMSGFSAECTRDGLHPTTEEIVASAPSFEYRVAEMARLRTIGEEVSRRAGDQPGEMTDQERRARGARMMELVFEVETWLRSDEGQAALRLDMAAVGAKLKPVIVTDDLASAIPD
jgi:hypothetical protein